jgi:hypothetical protein
MRTLTVIVVLGLMGAAPLARADAWRARPALESGAPAACEKADVSDLFFDLSDMGHELSLRPSRGEALLAPIRPDGSVAATFTVPVGRRNLSVDLTGNVKNREMEVFSKQYACRFKLVPVR